MGKRSTPARIRDVGEEGAVDLFRRLFDDRRQVPVGIGDDGAVVEISRGRKVLFTADHMAEGVHFTCTGTPPEALAWKLAAANASDIASMGGRPAFALLSLALPGELELSFLRRFARGLKRASLHFGFQIVGGDTTASMGGIFASLALLGTLEGRRPLLRSGARPGDILYVSGHLGASALGLAALESKGDATAPSFGTVIRRHLRPSPPLALGAALGRSSLPSAAIDLSDGLSSDLARLCRESGAGARVRTSRLPVRRSTLRAADALGLDAGEAALHGGEEYELLFTVPRGKKTDLERLARRLKVPVTAIGEIAKGRKLETVGDDGSKSPLEPRGWRHFLPGR